MIITVPVSADNLHFNHLEETDGHPYSNTRALFAKLPGEGETGCFRGALWRGLRCPPSGESRTEGRLAPRRRRPGRAEITVLCCVPTGGLGASSPRLPPFKAKATRTPQLTLDQERRVGYDTWVSICFRGQRPRTSEGAGRRGSSGPQQVPVGRGALSPPVWSRPLVHSQVVHLGHNCK